MQKWRPLLLILICIFAACSEQDNSPLLETEILQEAAEANNPKEVGYIHVPPRCVEYPYLQ